MKKHLLLALTFSISIITVKAQNENKVIRCYAEEHFQEMAKQDPSLLLKRAAYDMEVAQYLQNQSSAKTTSANLIIPVVVHVIHTGGVDNISDAQIKDQIRILNEDYQRLNPDTANTPAAFSSIVGRANVEFRLATKDPAGNCTDGIIRIFNTMGNGPYNRDELKSVSYWNSQKYLNIWVVANIDAGTNTSGGTILGYAQFPNTGTAATDGVVIRADQIGSIGTAATSPFGNGKGRTATHEVGHWLNLRHIWGDQTCGSDAVSDTPTHEDANSGCPSFPHNVGGCTGGNSNGEFYVDYMDYTNGSCQNSFSAGQVARMMATLTSSRATLVSSANNIATGTDDASYAAIAPCAPVAYFAPDYYKVICQGGTINYVDQSYRALVSSRSWTFQGGSPTTSTDSTEVVTYATPGIYNTSLSVTGPTGTDAETRTGKAIVLSNIPGNAQSSFTESFEDNGAFASDWTVLNYDNDDGFAITGTTSFTGTNSVKLGNYGNTGELKDEMISPIYNLSWMESPTVTFKLHYAPRSTTSYDKLKVYVSTNCGSSWSLRYNRSSNGTGVNNLNTSGNKFSAYTPAIASSEWREESFTIPSAANQANVRLKFEFTSGNGNNLYVDDINISATNVGIEKSILSNLNLSVYPNPSVEQSTIAFNLTSGSKVSIALFDMLGKKVEQIFEGSLQEGQHTITLNNKQLAPGSYFVRANVNGVDKNVKLIISQ